ncbi:MAG: DUF2206 domain-containing protein [Methanobacterium sp.]|nr:DUF2206 domain-containing protein [Methanobacterium sp.]
MELNISNSNLKIFIICMQISILGIVGLEYIGIQISVLREIIGVIYLIFIPGLLLFKIIGIQNVNNVEKLLYIIGLSISTIIFIGYLMNLIYPLFGISNPIAFQYILLTMTILVMILFSYAYLIKMQFGFNFNIKNFSLHPFLFLSLLPLLSIIGTYYMNIYENNIFLIILIILISLTSLLIGFGIFIKKEYYPLAIYAISISLILHTSLISMYLWGWDVQYEYFFSNLVSQNGFWGSSLSNMYNQTLSLGILAPIFSVICNLGIIWVFKIIFPMIFALVPLGLYVAFKKQFNHKISFFACLIFTSFFVFFVEILQVLRQQIAEFFLMLLILLLFNSKIDTTKKSLLFLIFSGSLVVSHYGLAYIYMLILVITIIIVAIMKLMQTKNFNRFGIKQKISIIDLKKSPISLNYVIFFIVICIAWYMSFSRYNAFEHLILIGRNIFTNILDIMNVNSAQGMAVVTQSQSMTRNILKYLNLSVQFFIGIGILSSIINIKKKKKKDDILKNGYLIMSIACFTIAFFGVILPYFGSALNVSRLYQITLLFLAPFSVLGFMIIFNTIQKIIPSLYKINEFSIKAISIFCIIFLLFNTGLMTEMFNEDPFSISLNANLDNPLFNKMEVYGARWINTNKNTSSNIYADEYRYILFLGINYSKIKRINHYNTDSYLFLGTKNILNEKFVIKNIEGVSRDILFLFNK